MGLAEIVCFEHNCVLGHVTTSRPIRAHKDAIPFLYADASQMGKHNLHRKWVSWWRGIWRLSEEFGGVIRWQCPHRHKTAEAALKCSRVAVIRHFWNKGRVEGMFT